MIKINVITIISDTFRYDHLGSSGNRWIQTPNLDLFAEKSMIFDRAYAASFPTIPHRHDLFTGQYTFTHSGWEPLKRNEIILPQLLRQAGYVTQLINDTGHMLSHGMYYQRGFDGWLWIRGQEMDAYATQPIEIKFPCDPRKLRNRRSVVQYLRNVSMRKFENEYFVAKTMTEASKWLELNYDKHEKFFLYIDTFSPHEPWDPPKWYVDKYDPNYEGEEVIYPSYEPSDYLTSEEVKHCKALYAGEVTLVDNWVGNLLAKVEDLGLLENTAIFFTSDHGFYHGEHGLMGKSIIIPKIVGYYPLYEETAHVPLIVYLPDEKGGKRSQALVQPPDLTSTIIELIEAKEPATFQGKSLVPLLKGENVNWRDFAVTSPSLVGGGWLPRVYTGQRITITSKNWSLIYTGDVEKRLKENPEMLKNYENIQKYSKIENELYDLSRDPRQQSNRYDGKKDIADQLISKLVKFLENLCLPEEFLKYWR
jgi:arylsulfatase A-like enzyme